MTSASNPFQSELSGQEDQSSESAYEETPKDEPTKKIKRSTADVFRLLETQVANLAHLISDVADQKGILEYLKSQLSGINESITTTSVQSSEALQKSSKNEIAIEIVNQKMLKNYIDISGIPLTRDENIIAVITGIFSALGLAILETDINTCYRVGHQTRTNSKGEPIPPTIVVGFLRERTKEEVLTAAKQLKRAMTTVDIGWKNTPPSKIYLNERLTPYFRNVFMEARKFKARNMIKFLWTKGGVIHGRVDDGSPILTFASVDEIYHELGGLQVHNGETCSTMPQDPSSLHMNLPGGNTDPNPNLHNLPLTNFNAGPANINGSSLAPKHMKLRPVISQSKRKRNDADPNKPKRRGRRPKYKDGDPMTTTLEQLTPTTPTLISGIAIDPAVKDTEEAPNTL